VRHVNVAFQCLQRIGPKAARDGAGLDQRDMDARAAQLRSQGVGEALERELGGLIGASKREGRQAEHRAVLYDAPRALAAHHRQDAVGEILVSELAQT